MKFRNLTTDDRFVPSLGVTVAAGDTTPDLDDEQADGFILQADVWRAVGKDGQVEQAAALDVAYVPDDSGDLGTDPKEK